jgi:hypothetical protein
MHQTVGDVLRTFLHGNPPQNIANAEQYVDEALSIAMHAIRVGIHTTLGSSPCNLVFNRDMFLNIQLIANWHCVLTSPPEARVVSNTKAYQSPLDVPPPPRSLTTRIKAKLRGTY